MQNANAIIPRSFDAFHDIQCRLSVFALFFVADKVKKKYGHLGKEVLLVELEKGSDGLGISLAGHKDRNKMAVFVCGINPNGAAHKKGTVMVGDEILEVCMSRYTYDCF